MLEKSRDGPPFIFSIILCRIISRSKHSVLSSSHTGPSLSISSLSPPSMLVGGKLEKKGKLGTNFHFTNSRILPKCAKYKDLNHALLVCTDGDYAVTLSLPGNTLIWECKRHSLRYMLSLQLTEVGGWSSSGQTIFCPRNLELRFPAIISVDGWNWGAYGGYYEGWGLEYTGFREEKNETEERSAGNIFVLKFLTGS